MIIAIKIRKGNLESFFLRYPLPIIKMLANIAATATAI